MTNDPWRKRATRQTLLKWLEDNPKAWEGYPKTIPSRGAVSHAKWIFNFMQNDGLFSPRSQCNPKTITRLVEDARAAKKFN